MHAQAQMERPRVLLVEDESSVRRSIQLMLQANGYDVRAFASGALALADPAAVQAACLVTEYRMADMDGVELLRRLRSAGWRRPAILITAYRAETFETGEDAARFDAVLEKPLLPHRLLSSVDRATGRA